MKRIYLLSFFFLAVCSLSWAQRADESTESTYVVATQFGITRPLSEIFSENPVKEELIFKPKTSGDRKIRKPQFFEFSAEKDGPAYGNDPKTMQTRMGVIKGSQLRANWLGQTASGFRPYDPSGAVGPNHYVQMINSTTFKVYNKTTGAVSLTATLGNLWSPATANAGDPIVMYDKAADRWFLAQFGSGNNNIYIAISTSPDPTGTYYTYTFTSPQFPDYLKFGVWHDGYYMTSNQSTQKVFAFERTAMLAGTAGARSVIVNFSPPTGGGFFCPVPGCAADGVLPPTGTPCPIFSYSDNAWGGANIDGVKIYNMAVNWTPTTPTATITATPDVAATAFDASYNASWNDCSQPGTTQKLDGIGGVIMYRAQWKTWPTHNSVVLNWAVKISASQRSIKWCELRQNKTTGVWSMYQEGIYTPDAATRWMGAICMDNNGSIGLSYMKSDATSIYPGLYYTGRRECDPLGTMPITEVMVVAGTGYQTGTNRNGDYAHTCLDPDGFTFWSTSEYMGGTSGGSAARTRIFSYTIDGCTTDASVFINVTSGSNPTCAGASLTFTATPYNGGTAPSYQWKVDGVNVGTNSATYSSSSLTAGQVVTCVMTSNLAGVTANPATSNAITISVAPSVTPSVSIALTSGTNPTCPGVAVTFTATPTNGGAAPSYQWQVNGANVGTNSNTFTSTTLATGSAVRCVMTSNAQCPTSTTATSNEITITITTNSNPTVTITPSTSGSICAGTTVTFNASVSGGSSPSYQWKVDGVNVGTNSNSYSSSSFTNGQVVTCQVTTASSCPSFFNLGTGTTVNSLTSGAGAAYATYYGNGRQQYIIRASELTALGMAAGSSITSLGFDVGSATGDPLTLNGFTIKMGNVTATTSTTTFQTGATTVFGPVNYTPTLNSINTHTLTAPFTWNGTSNIIVESCFSNQVVGNQAYQTRYTNPGFVSVTYYQADGATGAGACTQATGTTSSNRPNMKFGIASSGGSATSNAFTMSVTAGSTYYADTDGDGYGNAASSTVACSQPSGYVSNSTDCNDANSAINPAATEVCNAVDDDCDSQINEGVGNTYYADADADGYGNAASSTVACTQPSGYVSNNSDCNDANSAINPAATEVCNAVDDDCDGQINEGVGNTYYADTDGDGYGNAASSTVACTQPSGYVSNSSDCNDNNSAINPAATEVCNTVDDDCDGQINEGVGNTYYADTDGDGYGNAASSTEACTQPSGYVSNSTDCDDANSAINPGVSEVCSNTIDDNCNGQVNENCCALSLSATTTNTSCTASNNGSIDLSVSGGSTYSYSWNTGATSQDLSNLAAGTYTVTVTSGSCSQSASYTVGNNNQVQAAPTAIDGPYGACRNSSGIVFTTPAVAGATSYLWTLPVGATGSSTTNSITLSFNSGYSTGNLTVRAVGLCGTSSSFSRAVYALTSVPGAPASITGPISGVCAGTTQTYTCATVAAATSYQWTAPTNATIVSGQGTQTVSIAFASNFGASGNVVVRSQNCAGLGTTTRTLTVYNIPATPGTISGQSTNVCPGSSLTYIITAVPGASSYLWTAPTNATITAGQGTNTVTVSYASAFVSGSLTVRAVSSCGQSAVRSLTVSKNPTTTAVISGQSSNLCGGGQFIYTIAAVNGAVTYNWTAPVGCTIVSSNLNTVTINIPSTFTTGTLSVACVNSCGGSITRTLSLTRLPATPASITGPASVCPSQVGVNFTTPAVTGVTNTWTVPTGASITAGQGTTSMTCNWGTAAGSVTVRGVNACGQSAARSKALTLLTCMEEQEEGAVDNTVRADEIAIYPNPNDGTFFIRSAEATELYLLNGMGQLIEVVRLNASNNFSFEVSGLSTGFYFLQGTTAEGYINQKVIVTNR